MHCNRIELIEGLHSHIDRCIRRAAVDLGPHPSPQPHFVFLSFYINKNLFYYYKRKSQYVSIRSISLVSFCSSNLQDFFAWKFIMYCNLKQLKYVLNYTTEPLLEVK